MFSAYELVEVEKEVPFFSWKEDLILKKHKVKERIEFYKPYNLEQVIEELKNMNKDEICEEIVITFRYNFLSVHN